MEKVFIIFCMFAASSAIFFPLINLPNQRTTMMNICIYSVNPARYQPKCFLCPSNVYPNVLRACVNAAIIPSNISFTQASCIEQNCAISRGKRSVDLQQPDNLLEKIEPIDQRNDLQSIDQEPTPAYPTVGSEEFVASEYDEDLDAESDYADMAD